ncbi:Spb1 C-terminal domain-containing protein, partial [Schizophyllum fasciatum]
PLDIGMEQADASLGGQDDFFDLDEVERSRKGAKRLAKANMDDEDVASEEEAADEDGDDDEEPLDSDEERERRTRALEDDVDGLYTAYRQRLRERDAKFKAKEARMNNPDREETWTGIREAGSDEEEDSDVEGAGWAAREQRKFAEGEDSSDESDVDDDDEPSTKRRRTETGAQRVGKGKLVQSLEGPKMSESQASKIWFSQDVFAGIDDDVEDDEEEISDEEVGEDDDVDMEDDQEEEGPVTPEDDDDFEIVPLQKDSDDEDMWDVEDENEDTANAEKIRKYGLNTAETVTLAQALVNRNTTKTHLINDGFSRYSLNSKEDLPPWFLDDEQQHYKPNLPVTKEAIAALRARQRALDARPIKKIAEAKARKKFKAAQRLEKAMKKAEGVNETADLSEREKAAQIEKLMRKGASKGKPKTEVKVVFAKGAQKGVKGRPKGVKGRYQMVDARGKKELRAKKRAEKANKKRKRA